MGARTSLGPARGFLPALLLLVFGCATGDLIAQDGGYRHRRHNYAFERPPPPWTRIPVEGGVIAFRRPGPATMSLQSRCGGPVAEAATLARHLRIGLRPYTLRQAGPAVVAGREGWSQVFDTVQDGAAVRVKTVTLVARGCVIDWVLVTGRDFEQMEGEFDSWVAGLRPPTGSVATESSP